MAERITPPSGVIFVAVLAGIVGVAQVLSGVQMLLSDETSNVWFASLDFFVGGLAILTGLTMLTGDNLGRVISVVVFVTALVAGLLNLFSIGPGFVWGTSILGAVLSVVGIVLLFSRRSNEFFARGVSVSARPPE